MLELQQGESSWVPAVLIDASGSALAGILVADLFISICKSDQTKLDISASTAQWVELTGAAYVSTGYYNLYMSSTYLDTTGVFQYGVRTSSSQLYRGFLKVTAGDTGHIYNRLGAPNYGSITNDIANVGVTAGSGGFTSADRALLSATSYTCSLLPADPASQSGVLAAVTQSFWTSDRANLNQILTSTIRLPSDPASQATVTSTIIASISSSKTAIMGASSRDLTVVYNLVTGTSTASLWYMVSATWHTAGFLPADPASQSGTVALVTGVLGGVNYGTGTDSLHAISQAIAGISGTSGSGGGFSSDDRAALNLVLTATINLPSDPTSWATVSGALTSAISTIMGSGSGHATGTNIWQVAQDSYTIRLHTNYIQTTNQVATTSEVNAARDYLAGSGYTTGSASLAVLAGLFTGTSYTATDRAMLSGIFVTESLNRSDFSGIRNKTDNLPSDPVSTAHMDTLLYEILSASAVSGGFSNDDRAAIQTILTSTNRLPTHPADQDITFGSSDRTYLLGAYGKTQNLPSDPASITYMLLVSQSLTALITSSFTATNALIVSSSSSLSAALSSSTNLVLTRLGSPASGSVSADIGATYIQATNGYLAGSSADTHAQQAISAAQAASAEGAQISALIGTPMSGTVSADVRATFLAAVAASSTFSGTISASVDFGPLYGLIGTPAKTLADDVKETARIATAAAKAAAQAANNV